MEGSTPGIRLSGLGKRYGDQWAVRGLDLEVSVGEVVGLLGPNGAGKSTTMRVLTSNTSATEGSAWVNGEPVKPESTASRVGLGYLPESNPLYPELSVMEYLRYVCQIYRVKDRGRAVERAVGMTGLGEVRHKRIGVLSKGFRQRVGLAAAIVPSPRTLVLDEPTAGLDANQLVEVRQLIRSLAQDHAILLSSHIMQEVEQVCDRVVILNRGRVVASGPTRQLLLSAAGHTLLVRFDGYDKGAKLLAQWFPGYSVEQLEGGLLQLSGDLPDDLPAAVFRRAAAEGYTLSTLYARPSQLEDLFQQLTGKGGAARREDAP